MINSLFQVVLTFVIATFNLILSPIYAFVTSILGFHFSDLIDSINQLLNLFINFVPFIIDMSFISPLVVKLLVDYLIFKYTAKFGVFAIKMTVKWYNILKG